MLKMTVLTARFELLMEEKGLGMAKVGIIFFRIGID
tara:strand:- start:81175 stop:81282 length:108 start_codon:yes stop_codon:yes gene_type:complete